MTFLTHHMSVENMFFDLILINFLFLKYVIFFPIDCPLRHTLSKKTLKNLPDLLTKKCNSPGEQAYLVREGRKKGYTLASARS